MNREQRNRGTEEHPFVFQTSGCKARNKNKNIEGVSLSILDSTFHMYHFLQSFAIDIRPR